MTTASGEPNAGHAFISYVHEDSARVDRLQSLLELAGISVWRDRDSLWPGEDWRVKIRQAIQSGALAFIACFSDASVARERSYQNEELVIAIEEFRLRRPDRPWLYPVRFDECDIPAFDLGAGRTFDSLHRVDLVDDRWDKSARLVGGVLRTLGSVMPSSTEGSRPVGAGTLASRMRVTLNDPMRQIELEEDVVAEALHVKAKRTDAEIFPLSGAVGSVGQAAALVTETTDRYFDLVQPLCEALIVGGWFGVANHEHLWSRAASTAMTGVAETASGEPIRIGLRRYPLLPILYSVSLAAVAREKFGALRAVAVDATTRVDNRAVPLIGVAHLHRPFTGFELSTDVVAHHAEGSDLSEEAILALQTRGGRRYTPVSDHILARLRDLMSSFVPDNNDYEDLFDRTEVLLAAITEDVKAQAQGQYYVDGMSFGRHTWRQRHVANPPELILAQELAAEGSSWPPLRDGLFGGAVERAEAALVQVANQSVFARSRR